ncbi:MAG: response regulator [Deltaproteobacteria bacterium]|nr:MAG: response regulator [Deltaproteobacteria bacterium]
MSARASRAPARRVLVVENDPESRRMTKVLALEGYETLEAPEGRSAIALAKQAHPDLIIMDLAMPELDGWEASRRLKADPKSADIPIIALTAFAMREDEERARKAGCDGYLSKPCRPQTIRATVRNFLAPR